MPVSLKSEFSEAFERGTLQSLGDPVVSVDCDGVALSRFHDRIWVFTHGKSRSSRRQKVDWSDDCGPNVIAAKQLAYLCLTHGEAVGPNTALRKCRNLARLAVFCASRGIDLKVLHRHPQVVIDFVQRTKKASIEIAALARVALSLRDTLGWTFLEADQIAAIENIRALASYQYPVIPRRIYIELDDVAHSVLYGYLAAADELDGICHIWGPASRARRKTTANWKHLLSQRPKLAAELSKWGGKSPSPISCYVSVIRAAACWVIAGGSCARREEILSLRRGCLTRELVGDHVAHLLSAATTKTMNNANAIWVVSPRIEPAIHALERLLKWYERTHSDPPNLTDSLFQVFDYNLGQRLPPSATRMGRRNHGEPVTRIDFSPLLSVADTRISNDDWAEAKRLTPTLDERKFAPGKDWVPSAHQLRRTVLVFAAASGLVSQDSLSFQAKHQTWKMTSYYCEHYWHLANTDPGNRLVAGTRQSDSAEFTEIYADAYNLARSRAMEEDRLFSPYGRDHKRLIISDTPLLSLDEIRSGLAHAVLKRNTLGLCAQADFCEWQKAITVRGCMTKADGEVCAKAIIDADRVGEIRALQEDLTCQLETLHARDSFAREQVEADIAATVQAIALIEQHSRGQHAEA